MKKITLYLHDEEESIILDRIIANSPLQGLSPDRNTVIRFIIRDYERLASGSQVTKADLLSLEERILGSRVGNKKVSYSEKKEMVEKTKKAKGSAICTSLGGVLEGEMCRYTKYEITAGGLVKDWVVAEHIDVLSDKHIDEQYYPSKVEWQKAKASEDSSKK